VRTRAARYPQAATEPRYSRRMAHTALTLVVGDHTSEVRATTRDQGTVSVPADDLERATGWGLRAEGLCRGDVCVPVRDRASLVIGDEINLDGFATALHRPLAAEPAAALAVIGESAATVSESSETLVAPEFTLPDVDGRPVSLSDYAGRKRLLMFWSSW